jgi:lipoate-protein ligase A
VERNVWRLLVDTSEPANSLPEARPGAENMAVDQALFESAQHDGTPALRFYRWTPACLSLGRHQSATVDLARLERAAIDLVRRPTGGLAVLHDCELTYCVVLPVGLLGSPRETYETINQSLLMGLSRLGVRAMESATVDSGPKIFRVAGSCFAGSAPGEVVVRGRKVIGSAQRCEQRTILQHGSILLDGKQTLADELLGRNASDQSAITLRAVLGRLPDWAELVRALTDSFQQELGIALAPAGLSAREHTRVHELTSFFASREWTWRV